MLRMYLVVMALAACFSLSAQEWPLKINVPAVSTDINQQFGVLHFSAESADKYTIFYYQPLSASIVASNEFLRDTGSIAFTDDKKRNAVPNSDQALLLVKQSVSANGSATTEKIWVLAKRKFESADNYRLYFRKGFVHPVIKSNTPVTLTVHNLDNVSDLNSAEREALTMLVKREFLPDAPAYIPQRRETTLAEGLSKIKSDFKTLRQTAGKKIFGDLPLLLCLLSMS